MSSAVNVFVHALRKCSNWVALQYETGTKLQFQCYRMVFIGGFVKKCMVLH